MAGLETEVHCVNSPFSTRVNSEQESMRKSTGEDNWIDGHLDSWLQIADSEGSGFGKCRENVGPRTEESGLAGGVMRPLKLSGVIAERTSLLI